MPFASNDKSTKSIFEVQDDGRQRADLISRRETKYVMEGADVGMIRSILATNCSRVVHANRVSVVRSIYFDDFRMTSCFQNIEGVGKRNKVRIRWYDQLVPGCHFFFEVKWRNNLLTGKHRYEIKSDRPISEMTFPEIWNELEKVLPSKLHRMLLKYSNPTVMVEYKREHFVSMDKRARLTLDYDLVFRDQSGLRRVSPRYKQPMDRMLVVEGKTVPGEQGILPELLHPLSTRASRCSKYVHGCQLLGLVKETD